MHHTLLLVDIQNDFMPGGALPVSGAHEVVPVANRLIAEADLVVATQDWHPAGHGSFASSHPGHEPFEIIALHGLEQTLWPDHCIQDTTGADFVPKLASDRIDAVFRKGSDPTVDSYSGFFDNGRRHATGLGSYLREREVRSLTVVGVATDVCVKATVLDALSEGFDVVVVPEGCRGVDANPGDSELALQAMARAGATIL